MKNIRNWQLVLLAAMLPFIGNAQDEKAAVMDALSEMIGGKWVIQTKWENGGEFHQEQIFEWGLNETIIKVTTFGTVNQKTGEFGLRNEGIRAWDGQEKVMKFWEFDVFGGITTGTCGVDSNAFYYEYEYAPDGNPQTFRDVWTKIDLDTYKYQVGTFADGAFSKVFLEVTAKRSRD